MSDRDKLPRWVLWLSLTIASAWLLYTLRGVLAPVFFAFLIAYMLDPLVDRIVSRAGCSATVDMGVLSELQ